jgi:hypothetical protein
LLYTHVGNFGFHDFYFRIQERYLFDLCVLLQIVSRYYSCDINLQFITELISCSSYSRFRLQRAHTCYIPHK